MKLSPADVSLMRLEASLSQAANDTAKGQEAAKPIINIRTFTKSIKRSSKTIFQRINLIAHRKS